MLINPSDISPQQMKIFIAAAETENFSQAARIANVTQPLISQTISTLEHLLGLNLFYRKGKKITLSPEGKVLLDEWKNIYYLMTKSIEKVHGIYHGESSDLHLITHTQLKKNDLLFPLVDSFKNNHPNVTVIVEDMEFPSCIFSIKNNVGDIGFALLENVPADIDEVNFSWQLLFKETVCAYVPLTLAISEKEQLAAHDFKDIPIALLDPSVSAIHLTYNNSVLKLLTNAGITPRIHSYSSNFNSLMLQREFANAVVIASSAVEAPLTPKSKRIPIINWAESGQIVFWNKNTVNKNVLLFVSFAVGFFKN